MEFIKSEIGSYPIFLLDDVFSELDAKRREQLLLFLKDKVDELGMIEVGKGVCGTAVATGQPQVVINVLELENHIACDSASRSELVIPIYKEGTIFGVLDIDSPSFGRFGDLEKASMVELVRLLETSL